MFLDLPYILETRRNHALEHATLHVLARTHQGPLAGHSNPTGYFILGQVTNDDLRAAAQEARSRLNAGEHELAVHPGCGTNLATSLFFAGTLAWLPLRGRRSILGRLALLPLAVAFAAFGVCPRTSPGTRSPAAHHHRGRPRGIADRRCLPCSQRCASRTYKITGLGGSSLPSLCELMPILFLYGTDEFAISRRISDIASQTDRDGMNTSRFEARLAGEEELNNAVNSMPFLTDRRLVILSNPSQKFNSADTKRKFTAFLAAVPSTTLLVLHETLDSKAAEKHWLVKWTAKSASAKAEALMAPRARDMNVWIVNETKDQGGKITSGAAAKLAELVGADTRQASQEIAKVLTYVNWERPVDVQDVQAVCVSTAEVDIFEFVDGLAGGDGKRAQSLLRKMLEERDAFSIFPMIIRQFRLLIQAREIVEARGMVQDVQEALGVHPFVAGKVYQQAGRFTMRNLESIYRRLLVMDEAAKTSAMPLDTALEMFVVEMSGRS